MRRESRSAERGRRAPAARDTSREAARDTAPRRARRRRDRRGRGVRGRLAPVEVPLSRTRGEQFDELVMDAVDELEEHWGPDLAGLEFAVEDVPPAGPVADRRPAGHGARSRCPARPAVP